MKKIIAGKKYDTETATMLGERTYSNPRDFSYVHEELYIKRTGEYFIYGEGGANTKYRQWIDDHTWTGGDRIKPITEQEARKWVEEHLDGDDYERIFGKVYEDGTMVIRTYSVPTYIADKLKKEALNRGVSASQLLCDLVENM